MPPPVIASLNAFAFDAASAPPTMPASAPPAPRLPVANPREANAMPSSDAFFARASVAAPAATIAAATAVTGFARAISSGPMTSAASAAVRPTSGIISILPPAPTPNLDVFSTSRNLAPSPFGPAITRSSCFSLRTCASAMSACARPLPAEVAPIICRLNIS